MKNEFIYLLTTSRLFYFNGAENDIFGAEKNKIAAEKDKFGAETDEFILKKIGFYIPFTLGAENGKNT
jgi:hypothetical protein